MEIRHLITFQTIIEAGSYTAAAQKLGYTQSTITSHIQRLEDDIGGPLFNYIRKNLQLTPLGKELIPLAEDLLSTHNQISNMQNQHEVRGTLRVAAPESLTISRLGDIIGEFSMKYPHVNLKLTNGTCGQNQSDLLSGRVDIALMVYPELTVEKCHHYYLAEEPIVIVTDPGGPDNFMEYAHHKEQFYITNEEGCSYRTIFERYLLKQDMQYFQTMELWSIEAIKQTVMSGIGFAALPYMTVKEEVESGKLKTVQHTGKLRPIYSQMLIKDKKWMSPTIEAFADIVLNSMDETKIEVS